MDQTDGLKVPHLLGSELLREEGDERTVNHSESTTIKARHRIERSHDVHFNDVLADYKETSREPIRSGTFIEGHALDDIPHLFRDELPVHPSHVDRGDPRVVEVKRERTIY
jgi:hypothetical protein